MAGAEFQDVAGEFVIPLDVEALADKAALRVWDKGLSYGMLMLLEKAWFEIALWLLENIPMS